MSQIETTKKLNKLWEVTNGYLFPEAPDVINEHLTSLDTNQLSDLQDLLEIGVQWNTEVTIGSSNHTVHQAYCSACPVSYSQLSAAKWKPLGTDKTSEKT